MPSLLSYSRWASCYIACCLLLVSLVACSSSGAALSQEAIAFQQMVEERPEVMNPREYDTEYNKDSVDQPPEIEGGMDAFYRRTLNSELPDDLRAGKSGVVVIHLVVSPEGEATNVSVKESLYPARDEAVRSVVLDSAFKPGQLSGKAVPVAMTLDVMITETSVSIR